MERTAAIWTGVKDMSTISIEEAQTRLPQIIAQLHLGDEVVITKDEQPVARLIAAPTRMRQPRRPGTLKGSVLYIAPDFDAPLDEFKEYMP
jgi:antitoxin (DNA-binding transcriptional repressor) of toxin-antitoxin stability system